MSCNNKNEDYYNYCTEDGSVIGSLKSNKSIKKLEDKFCKQCGSHIMDYNNYCCECGSNLVEIKNKKAASPEINVKKISTDSVNIDFKSINLKSSIENINFKSVICSSVFTVAILFIISFLLNKNTIDLLKENALAYGTDGAGVMDGKDILLSSMLNYNMPKTMIALKYNMISLGKVSLASRSIIMSCMATFIMFISANIFFKKEEMNNRNKALINTIGNALVYAAIFLIISILFSIKLNEDGVELSILASKLSVFINAFGVGIIGSYLGIGLKLKDNECESGYLFRKSINIVALGTIITTVLMLLGTYIIFKDQIEIIKQSMQYMNISNPMINVPNIIILVLTTGWYMFTLLNFAAINIFSITKFSLISVAQNLEAFWILGLLLIPIIMFVFVGRGLKKRHGDNATNEIIKFSVIYGVVMGLGAYASTVTISMNSKVLEFLNQGFISELLYDIPYEYQTVVSDYVSQILDTISSGVSIGPKMIGLVVASCIFSFIFVLVGYKSKK